MTENDEKVAEELATKFHLGFDSDRIEFDKDCERCHGYKHGFLAGIAHERARSQKLVEVLKIIATPLSDSINSSEVEIEQTLAAQRALKEYEVEANCICGEINARNCPVHQQEPTVDFGTFKARVEDL